MPPASVRRQACQPGGRPHTPGLRAAASRSPTEARPPASATHRSPSRRRAAGSSASPRSLPASSSRRPASSRPAAPTPSAVPAPGQTPPRALPRSGAWAYLDRLECSGRAFADPYPRNSRSETESPHRQAMPRSESSPSGYPTIIIRKYTPARISDRPRLFAWNSRRASSANSSNPLLASARSKPGRTGCPVPGSRWPPRTSRPAEPRAASLSRPSASLQKPSHPLNWQRGPDCPAVLPVAGPVAPGLAPHPSRSRRARADGHSPPSPREETARERQRRE